ncbi:MAG TPA: Isoquinoline 1-oxidoreductase subunit [Kofleriaceae bacterium]|nr:Isoquinoline 1-oxidoreductase subunit [Kofleriaceae bacterium]
MKLGLVLALALASCGGKSPPAAHSNVAPSPTAPGVLRAVADFDAIGDPAARSRALFAEAARVLTHPRCVNCHPSGDSPHQRMAMEMHDPPVVRGPANNGVPGMECTTCHQDRNQALTRVPGAPKWHLAPIEMAWVGKSPAYICNQIKDPKRNGGKTLAQIVDHSAHDALVAWGWSPGADREPVPGTQEQFGALVEAWVKTGAECPEETR